MTEPIYEYVKGKGWIIQQYPVVTMRCGTVVRLEPRMPNVGETWLRSTTWMNEDGTPQMEPFKRCATQDYESYARLCRFRTTTEANIRDHSSWEKSAWITVVRV